VFVYFSILFVWKKKCLHWYFLFTGQFTACLPCHWPDYSSIRNMRPPPPTWHIIDTQLWLKRVGLWFKDYANILKNWDENARCWKQAMLSRPSWWECKPTAISTQKIYGLFYAKKLALSWFCSVTLSWQVFVIKLDITHTSRSLNWCLSWITAKIHFISQFDRNVRSI